MPPSSRHGPPCAPARPGWSRAALATWFAVVVAGIAFCLVQTVVGVIALSRVPQTDMRVLVAFDMLAPLRAAAGWGVVWGGVVALVVARIAWWTGHTSAPGHDAVARRAAIVAAAVVGGGWLALVAGRSVAVGMLEDHGGAHPDLAWQVGSLLDWVAPVADGAGAAATALPTVLAGAAPPGPYAGALSPTTGGAAGLLYGWVVALVVRALADRRRAG